MVVRKAKIVGISSVFFCLLLLTNMGVAQPLVYEGISVPKESSIEKPHFNDVQLKDFQDFNGNGEYSDFKIDLSAYTKYKSDLTEDEVHISIFIDEKRAKWFLDMSQSQKLDKTLTLDSNSLPEDSINSASVKVVLWSPGLFSKNIHDTESFELDYEPLKKDLTEEKEAEMTINNLALRYTELRSIKLNKDYWKLRQQENFRKSKEKVVPDLEGLKEKAAEDSAEFILGKVAPKFASSVGKGWGRGQALLKAIPAGVRLYASDITKKISKMTPDGAAGKDLKSNLQRLTDNSNNYASAESEERKIEILEEREEILLDTYRNLGRFHDELQVKRYSNEFGDLGGTEQKAYGSLRTSVGNLNGILRMDYGATMVLLEGERPDDSLVEKTGVELSEMITDFRHKKRIHGNLDGEEDYEVYKIDPGKNGDKITLQIKYKGGSIQPAASLEKTKLPVEAAPVSKKRKYTRDSIKEDEYYLYVNSEGVGNYVMDVALINQSGWGDEVGGDRIAPDSVEKIDSKKYEVKPPKEEPPKEEPPGNSSPGETPSKKHIKLQISPKKPSVDEKITFEALNGPEDARYEWDLWKDSDVERVGREVSWVYGNPSLKEVGLTVEKNGQIIFEDQVEIELSSNVEENKSNNNRTKDDGNETDELNSSYKKISSCEELQDIHRDITNFREEIGGRYALVNDIDCSETQNWNEGKGFNPIGNGHHGSGGVGLDDPVDVNFIGVLDGNGYSIKNLYINRPDEENMGLFRAIGTSEEKGVVRNLKLENLYLKGRGTIGGITGTLYNGTISQVGLEGNISTADAGAGGIVGEISHGKISESYTKGKIRGSSPKSSTHPSTGGIAYLGRSGEIRNSYSRMRIIYEGEAAPENIGGLIGNQRSIEIVKSYSAVDFGFDVDKAGYNDVPGPLSGRQACEGGIKDSYWSISRTERLENCEGYSAGALKPEEMSRKSSYSSWDFSNVWKMSEAGYPVLRDNLPENMQSSDTDSDSSEVKKYDFSNSIDSWNYNGGETSHIQESGAVRLTSEPTVVPGPNNEPREGYAGIKMWRESLLGWEDEREIEIDYKVLNSESIDGKTLVDVVNEEDWISIRTTMYADESRKRDSEVDNKGKIVREIPPLESGGRLSLTFDTSAEKLDIAVEEITLR